MEKESKKQKKPKDDVADAIEKLMAALKEKGTPKRFMCLLQWPKQENVSLVGWAEADSLVPLFGHAIEYLHGHYPRFAFMLEDCLRKFCADKLARMHKIYVVNGAPGVNLSPDAPSIIKGGKE